MDNKKAKELLEFIGKEELGKYKVTPQECKTEGLAVAVAIRYGGSEDLVAVEYNKGDTKVINDPKCFSGRIQEIKYIYTYENKAGVDNAKVVSAATTEEEVDTKLLEQGCDMEFIKALGGIRNKKRALKEILDAKDEG